MNQTVSYRKCLLSRLTALLLWVGCLLWLSLTPSPPSPPSALLAWDKLQHAGAYALLTLLLGRFFILWRPLSRHSWRSAWLVAIVFGGLIEILQGTLSDIRQAEWGDLMANAIGATLVVVIANAREYRLRRQSTSR